MNYDFLEDLRIEAEAVALAKAYQKIVNKLKGKGFYENDSGIATSMVDDQELQYHFLELINDNQKIVFRFYEDNENSILFNKEASSNMLKILSGLK